MNPAVSSPEGRFSAECLQPADGQPVWLRVGTLFDGEHLHREAHLVYDAARIRWLSTREPDPTLVRPDQRKPDLVLTDHRVLPGLVEAHAHLFLEGGEEDPAKRALYLQQDDTTLLARAEERLERLVRMGIFAVRDAGDRNGVGLALAQRYRSLQRGVMPLLESPGPALHHQGRYGSFMGAPIEAHVGWPEAVDDRIRRGAQHIKLLATGIINFEKGAVTAKPQMPQDELRAAVAAAHARGRQVMVHCSGTDGVDNCIAARVDTIEHGFFITREQLAQMRDLGIAWVPTFAPVRFQLEKAEMLGWNETVQAHLGRILEAHAAQLAHAGEIGVTIVAGSDAGSHGVPHGHGLLWELELMEEAGLSTPSVLRAATGAAQRLHLSEPVGRLTVDSNARFVLAEGAGWGHVRHLRRPVAIVYDGLIFTGGDDNSLPGL
jgi:imidazolonepropionase-like amidohydrolase